MKAEKSGFTIIELLTVIAIMALLMGLLIPALKMARDSARKAKQKSQFAAIDLAILAYKNDFGDYPPSEATALNYCGSQKLAEALLGRDLLGFHPESNFDATDKTYYPDDPGDDNLNARMDRYLDLSTANAFMLDDLFNGSTGDLAPKTFVICDTYGVKKIAFANQTVKAGTPILYFKANRFNKTMTAAPPNCIYNFYDNIVLCDLPTLVDNSRYHDLKGNKDLFYSRDNYKIIDPKVTVRDWPMNPDSYILISAGPDGIYGSEDDLFNF